MSKGSSTNSNIIFVLFTEYSSIYQLSWTNQQQYKTIIESELGQAIYERQYPSFYAAAELFKTARLNSKSQIYINSKKPVNVYKEFWQYKQPGGTIFTDWDGIKMLVKILLW